MLPNIGEFSESVRDASCPLLGLFGAGSISAARRRKMNQSLSAWEHVEKLVWRDVFILVAILLLTRLLVLPMQRQLPPAAEKARPHRRLNILSLRPTARL